MIRRSEYAGSFYSANQITLGCEIEQYLQSADPVVVPSSVRAIVVPHAGYLYSGAVAAYAYTVLSRSIIKKVVILGPSHQYYFKGIGLDSVEQWESPLGVQSLYLPDREWLAGEHVSMIDDTHQKEHSLEVQLPFIQKVLPGIQLLPIMIGEVEDLDAVAKQINSLLDDQTLLVVSTDLSHFLTYDTATIRDAETIDMVLKGETITDSARACGRIGVNILTRIAQQRNWGSSLLKYLNSGDTAGDHSRVVGYSAFAFYDSEEG
ncbi:MAG: AmmeMemoRadiSam system protein B [Fibrobacterales bacterium]